MLKAYLAGPIAGCDDDQANGWRDHLMTKYPSGIHWLNPMVRDKRNQELDTYDVANIVEMDKRDIDNSDFVVAYCPWPSVGTSMEIMHCWEFFTKVYVLVPEDKPVSPWITYHATKVVRTWDELYACIRHELDDDLTKIDTDLEDLPF